MSRRIPGREATAALGWWRAHRFLVLRRLSQLGFIALFLAGPLAGIWIVKGSMASSLTLETVPLTDPLLLLAGLAAGHWPEMTAVVGALIVTAAYLIVGGRAYCSWACPINAVSDAAHWLHMRLGLAKGWQPGTNTRLGLLGLVLIGSAASGTLFFEAVNPVSIVQRGIVFGLWSALWVALAIFFFDLLVSRRGWCSRLCPVGAFWGQINRLSQIKVEASRRAQCDDCMDCFAVCPEPQVIRPALKGEGSPIIANWACTNCARCVDVCAKQVFDLTLRARPSAAARIPAIKEAGT